jgi:arginase family enzyme
MIDSIRVWDTNTVLRPAATFFGAKVGGLEDLGPESVACCGIFCDHFSEGEPGARFLARQFRYCSSDPWIQNSLGFNAEHLIDVGDLNVYPLEPDRLYSSLREQVARLVRTRANILFANPDFSLTPALIAGILEAKSDKQISVIRVSQRKDLEAVQGTSSLIGSRSQTGTRLSQLLGDRPDSLIWVQKCEDLTDEHYEMLKGDTCFLSVDADILGPAYGVTSAYSGGKSQRIEDVIDFIQSLKQLPIIAAEFTGHRPGFELRDRAVTTHSLSIFSALAELLKQGEIN